MAIERLTSPEDAGAPGTLIVPAEATWRSWSAAERARFVQQSLDYLEERRDLMSKGRPHQTAISQALDKLGLYYRRLRRPVYLAEELTVLYPGEEPFEPDILAVLGIEQPARDERMAWVVADEGRGPDLAIEVVYQGSREKDFVRNVATYARLGIPEYFIYDRLRQLLRGYRLPRGGATRYEEIAAEHGRLRSAVLDLDLAIAGGRLGFFVSSAELRSSQDLIDQLESMVTDVEARQADAEERAQREQERAQREQERAQREQERSRKATAGQGRVLLALLEARGLLPDAAARTRVLSCEDPALLERWSLRALSATSLAEIFEPA
jgi:Uma2 family endonuclease